MADMRQCDACGALEPASHEQSIGSGFLNVIRRERENEFAWSSPFGGRQVPVTTYHFCADCTRTLVAALDAHRVQRERRASRA